MRETHRRSVPSIFISHAHRDRHAAIELQHVLEDEGVETFLDQDRIHPGHHLSARVREGIAQCDALLLLWSAAAARSAWVHRELEMAQELSGHA